MTKEEYDNNRQTMVDATRKLLDEGKTDEAVAKMNAIDDLDGKWQAETDARSQFDTFYNDDYNKIPPEVMKMYGGEVLNVKTGTTYQTNAQRRDPLYLSDTRTMTNLALEKGGKGSDLMMQENALADTVRGMVTGKWSSHSLKNLVTTSTTGAIIPEVLSAQVIDQARNISLFTSAGVPIVPMESNNLKISRISESPTFYFKKEGEEGEELNVGIDSVDLHSHTIYGYAYVTDEAIESSQNLDAILRQVFAEAIADGLDIAMLYGQKDDEGNLVDYAPSGIMNDADILTLDAENAGYDDFVKAMGMIRQKNYVPTAWAINSYTDQTLALLKDNEGRYLPEPEVMAPMAKVVSNQLAYDEQNGSDGLVFLPTSMVIGMQNDIRIKIVEDERAVKAGMIAFQVRAVADCVVTTPNAICRIKGLK